MAHLTPTELRASYQTTMHDMRQELSAPARVLSRFVHAAIVRHLLSFLDAWLLRARSLLLGGVFASGAVIADRVITHLYLAPVSGSEPLFAFVFGYVIGLVWDLLSTGFKQPRT